MFQVGNIEVRFQHLPEVIGLNSINGKPFHGVTVCRLCECNGDAQDGEVFMEAESYCVPGDQFDRYEGRKQALTRALEMVESKELRTAIWKRYWEIVHVR